STPAKAAQCGSDRALAFVTGPPVPTTGQNVNTHPGAFLVSVDGPGGHDRFGVWRLWDLSTFPGVLRVAARLVNQSADTFTIQTSADNPLLPPPFELPPPWLKFVPNDVGIPEGVAA